MNKVKSFLVKLFQKFLNSFSKQPSITEPKILEPEQDSLKIRVATVDDCFSIVDLVKFAGPSGPESLIQIDLAKKGIFNKPCLGLVVVGEAHTPEQIKQFFQPNKDETIHQVPSSWRMPQLMKMLGCFPSASQASKNGWNRGIAKGFSEIHVKHSKARGVVFILNLDSTTEPVTTDT